MEPAEYLDAIATDADALAAAAERAGPDAPVPSCPSWKVADLLEHIGRVHRWAAANSQRPPDAEPWSSRDLETDAPDDHGERVAWVRTGAGELVAALDRAPGTPAWSFLPPPTVGFWQRRQAHETAMHRVDAQLADLGGEPIAAALAADGIDEWVSMLSGMRAAAGSGETIHLHCTDVPGEWLLTRRPDGVDVEREHAKGDVAAKGTASDLLLWLQGRGPVEALDVFGDAMLLERWREQTGF
jgi:uncharacterized protein (TIGR03083 family)